MENFYFGIISTLQLLWPQGFQTSCFWVPFMVLRIFNCYTWNSKIAASYSQSAWLSVKGFYRIELEYTSRLDVNWGLWGGPENAVIVIFRRSVCIICVQWTVSHQEQKWLPVYYVNYVEINLLSGFAIQNQQKHFSSLPVRPYNVSEFNWLEFFEIRAVIIWKLCWIYISIGSLIDVVLVINSAKERSID